MKECIAPALCSWMKQTSFARNPPQTQQYQAFAQPPKRNVLLFVGQDKHNPVKSFGSNASRWK